MKVKQYVILGDPIALARARVSKSRFYDSQKHLKLVMGMDIKKQHGKDPMFRDIPLLLEVIFYMPLQPSWSSKKKDRMRGQWHIFKPDSSNLLKFIEDVAIKICYNDDCLIAKQTIEKIYDDGQGPRTIFTLSTLDPKVEYHEKNG